MPTSTRGGRREGAGRKPLGSSPTKRTTVALTADDIDYLATIDPNISKAIRILIARSRQG